MYLRDRESFLDEVSKLEFGRINRSFLLGRGRTLLGYFHLCFLPAETPDNLALAVLANNKCLTLFLFVFNLDPLCLLISMSKQPLRREPGRQAYWQSFGG